jgi:hypothetical protein
VAKASRQLMIYCQDEVMTSGSYTPTVFMKRCLIKYMGHSDIPNNKSELYYFTNKKLKSSSELLS